MKQNSILSEIIKNGEIKLLPSERGSGLTREVHVAEHQREKYIVRICSDVDTARSYMKVYTLYQKYSFIPRLLEQKGKYLLFEYIHGRDLREEGESPEVIRQVGRIVAVVNKEGKQRYTDKRVLSQIADINKDSIVSPEKVEQIREAYYALKKKVKPETAFDANDVTADNFRLEQETGKVYFVDIEAIKPRVRGFGVAKAYIQWFKTPSQRKAFLQGYSSVASTKFLTREYLRFCYLCFLVQRIPFKFNKGEKEIVARSLSKLEKLLAGGII